MRLYCCNSATWALSKLLADCCCLTRNGFEQPYVGTLPNSGTGLRMSQ